MPTIRQKKLANALVDNLKADKPLNKQELVESVGYSPLTADRRAGEVINSEGVRTELVSIGFDPGTAKSVVAEILTAGDEDRDRLKAADMVFKVHGSYAPEKRITAHFEVNESPEVKELTKLLNDLYRGTGGRSDGGTSSAVDPQAQD